MVLLRTGKQRKTAKIFGFLKFRCPTLLKNLKLSMKDEEIDSKNTQSRYSSATETSKAMGKAVAGRECGSQEGRPHYFPSLTLTVSVTNSF